MDSLGGPLVSEETAREWADHFVVATAKRAQVLHLPAPDSDPETHEPLCSQLIGRDDVRVKSKTVFPPGHRRICKSCREELCRLMDPY